MDDQALVRKIKNGDRLAMDALIESYYQSVFSYFYRHTGDYNQSKDLTQQVFIKMVVNINRYQKRASFKSWLFTIAANTLKNHWRYLSRHPRAELSQEESSSESLTQDDIPMRMTVQQAIGQLPTEQRDAIILRFYHGFKNKEIAQMTDAQESTVKARIRYGLQKLKRILEGAEHE